jgi:hypothetical protein
VATSEEAEMGLAGPLVGMLLIGVLLLVLHLRGPAVVPQDDEEPRGPATVADLVRLRAEQVAAVRDGSEPSTAAAVPEPVPAEPVPAEPVPAERVPAERVPVPAGPPAISADVGADAATPASQAPPADLCAHPTPWDRAALMAAVAQDPERHRGLPAAPPVGDAAAAPPDVPEPPRIGLAAAAAVAIGAAVVGLVKSGRPEPQPAVPDAATEEAALAHAVADPEPVETAPASEPAEADAASAAEPVAAEQPPAEPAPMPAAAEIPGEPTMPAPPPTPVPEPSRDAGAAVADLDDGNAPAEPARPAPAVPRPVPVDRAAEQAAADIALLRTFGVRADPATPAAVSLAGPGNGNGAAQPVWFHVARRDGTVVGASVVTLLDDRGHAADTGGVDDGGRGQLRAPHPGCYVLVSTAPGHQPAAVALSVADAPLSVEVVLVRSTTLVGTVHDADGPVPGVVVALEQGGQVVASVRSGPDGTYRLADLAAGEFRLTATAYGRAPWTAALRVPEEADLRHDVDLAPAARGADGDLVPGRH